LNEKELPPDFLTDFFVGLLGYTRPADGGQRYTLPREKRVQVDGKYADTHWGTSMAANAFTKSNSSNGKWRISSVNAGCQSRSGGPNE